MSEIYHDLFTWIDDVLEKNLPEEIIAFNFNLYKAEESFHVQLVGTSSFDAEDDDWACDEIYSTEENIYHLNVNEAGKKWEEGLTHSIKLLNEYLNVGKQSSKLKTKKGVGVGFVDGDLSILYKQ